MTNSHQEILTARLLVLQSKRLMLSSVQRRLDHTGLEALKARVAHLRSEAEIAQHAYRTAMLRWGSPEFDDYWLVAYSKLIEIGNVVLHRMREAVAALPAAERYQVAADVEELELMLDDWTRSMREKMAGAVA